jgi:glutamate formiminotransferase / formiminotetrahydrofolate cyclodeaminase
MNRIVECVPNFSEGRRPEVIDAIVAAITSAGSVYLLDREMDADHNRAVITFVGAPESVGPAVVRGIEAAMRYIDLTTHRGEHPRIGATDVVPFVPIRGVTLAECVEIAKNTGREIAAALKIPVYLYEAAATRPDRINLENIRRGQFEGLRQEIESNPERAPDFGEPRIHPTAGATVVGARKPLIAYNINLNTPDVAIAKDIAKRIRFSSGGFPYVKAMGVFLKDRNQAQVSMNLTDFEQTPVELVFDTVRAEANRYGVTVAGSEIVGLIPQKALDQVSVSHLQVENFHAALVLENRLEEVISNISGSDGVVAEGIRGFVNRVSSGDPTPGGGSVAALSAALGAALIQMAVRLTREKKNYRDYAEQYAEALDRLEVHTSTLLGLIQADSDAYSSVMNAYRLPKTDAGRDQAIQGALLRATEVPSRTAQQAAEVLRLVAGLQSIVHKNVSSDVYVGVQILRAALRGGIANMRTNLEVVSDQTVRSKYEAMIAGWEEVLKAD